MQEQVNDRMRFYFITCYCDDNQMYILTKCLMVDALVVGSGGWHGLLGCEAGSEVCQGVCFEKWSHGEFLFL